MSQEDFDALISAAWDGEPVDLDMLREAVRTPSGRDLLASLLVVRTAACGEDIEPRDGEAARVAAAIARDGRAWYLRGPRVPLSLAATLAALAVAATVWLASSGRPIPAGADRPARVPVPAAAQPASTVAPQAPAERPCPPSVPSAAPPVAIRVADVVQQKQPPVPTRVIPFAGWREGSQP